MPWKGKPFGWGQPEPYIHFLPEPTDATANVLRQLTEHFEQADDLGGEIKIAVNLLESPSNDLATELLFQAYNSDCKLKRKVGGVPKPDPRKSKTKFKLWKYWFKTASPAVPRPERLCGDDPGPHGTQGGST